MCSVSVFPRSVVSGNYNLGIGSSSLTLITSGSNNVSIGSGSGGTTNVSNTITMGYNTTATADNQWVVGNSSGTLINNAYFGGGVNANAAAQTFDIHVTNGYYTNRAGWNFGLYAGKGTGTGTPGFLNFWTSKLLGTGTTLQTAYKRLELQNLFAVFNDDGEDYDFRFEGDTDANLLVLDASTDRVGIGVLAPAAKLDVAGTAKLGGASTDVLTMTGRVVFRTVASDPQHATPGSRPAGTLGEIVFYNGKWYGCTNASTPTWEKFTSV